MTPLFPWLAAALIGAGLAWTATEFAATGRRPRLRDLGVQPGILEPGTHNAITDVPGVTVGHHSLIEGESIRTGVTVILPHRGNLFQQKTPAAIVVGNGFGKLLGVTQVEELGVLETPIALTNTLCTFRVADALISHALTNNPGVESVNPVVGETNDGYLNDIRGRHVREEHVFAAIESASDGPVAEGCVGAGVGTRCFGWKGGIGTSSRLLPEKLGGYTLGVLVQTNFNGVLQIDGAPVGKTLNRYLLRNHLPPKPQQADPAGGEERGEGGSCMIVVATNAPLDARQLKRLGRRALLGLAATGSPMTQGSGDYVIAFSAAPDVRLPHQPGDSREYERRSLRDDGLTPLFQAAKEAVEEAIVNSLLQAETTTGRRGRTVEALPVDAVKEILRKAGR